MKGHAFSLLTGLTVGRMMFDMNTTTVAKVTKAQFERTVRDYRRVARENGEMEMAADWLTFRGSEVACLRLAYHLRGEAFENMKVGTDVTGRHYLAKRLAGFCGDWIVRADSDEVGHAV